MPTDHQLYGLSWTFGTKPDLKLQMADLVISVRTNSPFLRFLPGRESDSGKQQWQMC